MTMTTKELLALVGKATPGPWRAEIRLAGYAPVGYGILGTGPVAKTFCADEVEDEANAALIVAAVNALPALCAEVEALRKDAERYRWLKANVSGGSLGVPGGWIDTITAEWDTAIDAAKEPK